MFVDGVDGCQAGWVWFKVEVSSLATLVEVFDSPQLPKNRPSLLKQPTSRWAGNDLRSPLPAMFSLRFSFWPPTLHYGPEAQSCAQILKPDGESGERQRAAASGGNGL